MTASKPKPRPAFRFTLTLAKAPRSRKPTGAPRGRKALANVTPGATTWAEAKRLMIGMAAHSARVHYEGGAAHGRPISWATAIARAVSEASAATDDEQRSLVTFEAVERQIFPRARDKRR